MKLSRVSVSRLNLEDASGLQALPGLATGSFAVVDDKIGVCLAALDGEVHCVLPAAEFRDLDDLEGICMSPDGRHLWLVSESTRRLLSALAPWRPLQRGAWCSCTDWSPA